MKTAEFYEPIRLTTRRGVLRRAGERRRNNRSGRPTASALRLLERLRALDVWVVVQDRGVGVGAGPGRAKRLTRDAMTYAAAEARLAELLPEHPRARVALALKRRYVCSGGCGRELLAIASAQCCSKWMRSLGVVDAEVLIALHTGGDA